MLIFVEAFIVGLILSADSFSAALALGTRPFTRKDAFLFALSSGLAEALVALIGTLAGGHIISRFHTIDHWIAFILLVAVAVHMLYEGFVELFKKNSSDSEEPVGFHSFTKVILVSFATSLDALGVGVGLGVSHKPILIFVIFIGLWAFTTTLLGLYLAKKLSDKIGPYMNFLGAIVLTVLAFQMLKI